MLAALAWGVLVGVGDSSFVTFAGGTVLAAANIAVGAVVTWTIIAFFFRISSLAALVAAAFVPFFSFLLYGMNRFALEPAIALTAIALLIGWRHRTNIRNLLAGTEGRMGSQESGVGIQDSEKPVGD